MGEEKELYGDELVRTPYWQQMEKAKQMYARGNHRKAADMMIECFDLAPTVWSNERFNMFSFYLDYLCDNDNHVTDKDCQVLRDKFVENPREPALFRCRAALDLCFFYAQKGDQEEIMKFGRIAIELSKGASIAERVKKIKAYRDGTKLTCFVQDLFDDLQPKLDTVKRMVRFGECYKKTFVNSPAAASSTNKLDMVLLHLDKMGFMRYMAFDEHALALADKDFPVSKQDIETLEEKFIRNEEEPMLFRCRAACALVQIKWNQGDHEAATMYQDKALGFIQEADAAELASPVRAIRGHLTEIGGRPMDATVSDLFGDLTELFLEEQGPKQDEITQQHKITQQEIANICEREHMDYVTFASRMIQGGDDCDFCGKEKEELSVTRLAACGRCNLASYCSKECQRKHWKAGHCNACREPHDIRPGDLMKLHMLKKKSLNLRIVKVVRADPKAEGRWEVTFFDDMTPNVSVASEKLLHIRPLT